CPEIRPRSTTGEGGTIDCRTRSGFLGVQFERLVENRDLRSLLLNTPVARLTLTRHDNVVSCVCELRAPSDEGFEALRRRGAVEDMFMISPKLAPREFGLWLDRLLVEDLDGEPDMEVDVLELEALASS